MTDTLPDTLISAPLAIICEGDRAENVAQIPGPLPLFTNIFLDIQSPTKYQGWFIESYKNDTSYTIRNVGSEYWACACGGNVFDPATCVWYVQKAGGIQFKILVPNKDSVWTVRGSDAPNTVCLEPAVGSPARTFTF